MKLVQSSDEKRITLQPSSHKDGIDVKFEDKGYSFYSSR